MPKKKLTIKDLIRIGTKNGNVVKDGSKWVIKSPKKKGGK